MFVARARAKRSNALRGKTQAKPARLNVKLASLGKMQNIVLLGKHEARLH